MEYQDFSINENFLSSEDTIFIFHVWSYHGCNGHFSLSQWNLEKVMPYCYNVQNLLIFPVFRPNFECA